MKCYHEVRLRIHFGAMLTAVFILPAPNSEDIKTDRVQGEREREMHMSLPFSFSPNIVRNTVKLMGPGASFIMSSISSFFTFTRPRAGNTHSGPLSWYRNSS